MGILNISPESFYKKSVKTTKIHIKNTVEQMENEGADFIDVGGMSTAPYLSTTISENIESKRILDAIKIIQNISNLPISVDTCRSNVARNALENGIDIINDISGLKYDGKMQEVISKFIPSLILCAYDSKIVFGNTVATTKKLLRESLKIAKKSSIPSEKIVLDPAIGFFRKTGQSPFFTKIKSDWVKRDLSIIKNLNSIKQNHPILISVSNKSFLGDLLGKENPSDRLFGSIAAEAISVLNGADIVRTHNVEATKDAITIASKLSK
jgi:dihydropteroate synthase